MIHRVLVEVYKEGKEAAIHYVDVPEQAIGLLVIRKGASIRLLFALPPETFVVFHEMAVDFEKDVYVGVAASNLSQQPFTAKLENFKLTNLSLQDFEIKTEKLEKLVPPPFVILPNGTLIYEGALLKASGKNAGSVALQDMTSFKGEWSANKQLLWKNDAASRALTLDLPVDKKGKYEIKGRLTMAPDYAIAKLEIDGKPLNKGARTDFYSKETTTTDLKSLGTLALDAGKHRLTITVYGKNASSTGYRFGLDEIQLVPVK